MRKKKYNTKWEILSVLVTGILNLNEQAVGAEQMRKACFGEKAKFEGD